MSKFLNAKIEGFDVHISVIPNYRNELFVARVFDKVYYDPIVAFAVEAFQSENDGSFIFSSKPITADENITNDSDYAIFDKKSNEWFIPGAYNGIGEYDLIEYFKPKNEKKEQKQEGK